MIWKKSIFAKYKNASVWAKQISFLMCHVAPAEGTHASRKLLYKTETNSKQVQEKSFGSLLCPEDDDLVVFVVAKLLLRFHGFNGQH